MTFLIIDNYDSFVHNLARYVTLSGVKTQIVRNDAVTLEDIETIAPSAIILSPGPCTADDAGISIEVVKEFGHKTPILGVCLGHQAIAHAYGGSSVQSDPVHGMTATLTHDGKGLFKNLSNPMKVGRYHSLVANIEHAPDLIETAYSCGDVLMAIQHKTAPVYGVQFHPESILTENGLALIQNFVTITNDFHSA